MKLAVITDSSAYLEEKTLQRENLFYLGYSCQYRWGRYVEGVNLTAEEFYQKWLRLQNCLKPVNQVLPNWMRFLVL